MQLERRKVRLPRVERTEDVHPDDQENLGWAVSYSDLLMVLMSFFVIFFAASRGKKEAIFEDVSVALNKNNLKADELGRGTGTGAGHQAKVSAEDKTRNEYTEFKAAQDEAKVVNEKISVTVDEKMRELGVNVDTSESPMAMTINFPDNIYGKASFELNSKLYLLIEQVFEIVKPYKEKVDIHFVGHSDSNPLRGDKSGFVSSNYTLSALRASKALEYSLSLGYPSQQLFAQGGAENMRDSRSLSIRLVMRPAAVRGKGVSH